MAEAHRCNWGRFPSSLDETWTCPDCDLKWSAFDGRPRIGCAPECAEPTHGNHIGWTAVTNVGGQRGH